MKLPNGIEIISLEDRLAQVSFKASFGATDIKASDKLAEKIKKIGSVSQWTTQAKQDNFTFQNVNDVLPRDEDYIFVNFRALSKTIVQGPWLDWTKDNVLKDSVQLLLGATVYPNHNFWDINNWLGSVSNVVWDERGERSEGVPGINAEYKIDALMNPRIARGLLMSPPAIHSTSMTVLFEFEYSHPDIAAEDRWKFIRLLGEEVDGRIVRFIVTKIREYWEASLVFQGADRLAKKHDDDETDFENLSAENLGALPEKTAPTSDKEKTMKLTTEQLAALGLSATGDDVPEGEILAKALELAKLNKAFDGINLKELTAKAGTVDKYLDAQRTEVRRLARLAELGAEEGDLDEFVAQQIDEADYDRLVKMQSYYEKKAADKFPSGRSSQERSDEIEKAGGVSQKASATVPKIGLHD